MMMDKHISQIRELLAQRSLLYPLDIALVGATGVGKSSTINALFGQNFTKVGKGVDPETQEISHYAVDNIFRLHDTAGLGDGMSADRLHSKKLVDLLLSACRAGEIDNYGLIDLTMVIIDGSNRDMGTTYRLLESIVLKCISPERIIVCINQCDMAMKGRGWNPITNQPSVELFDFLEDKAISIQRRLYEATGLKIEKPIFYSAEHGYNLDVLMQHIINHLPKSRRFMTDKI